MEFKNEVDIKNQQIKKLELELAEVGIALDVYLKNVFI